MTFKTDLKLDKAYIKIRLLSDVNISKYVYVRSESNCTQFVIMFIQSKIE